jgi:hypothetical protein
VNALTWGAGGQTILADVKRMESSWQSELAAIRQRPAFYLGGQDLLFTRLLAFWAGYAGGYNAAKRGFMSSEQFVPADFTKFVTEYFGRKFPDGGSGWQTFIAENSKSEQEAFELFFRLREEYEKRHAKVG